VYTTICIKSPKSNIHGSFLQSLDLTDWSEILKACTERDTDKA